jgi:DNA-binding NtrC family response regulator
LEQYPLIPVLIVDDDSSFCRSLERALKTDFDVLIALSAEDARKLVWKADAVLLDIKLDENNPKNQEGMTLLPEFREFRPHLPVIMMTAYGEMGIAIEAMKLGAADFLSKPLDLVKLKTTIKNVLKQARLNSRISNLEKELGKIEPVEFVGKSSRLNEIRRLIDSISADGYITVLITGETGTGKELAARLIHQKGWRSQGPFVAISLAAVSPTIVERELFGHEKGAFTDARETKPGYIEQSHKGILFLDDIDAAPLDMQTKLLRFLEEKSFYRLGSTRSIRVDVQVITATNQDLSGLVKSNKFREDLYYRINAVEIHLPPLREHPEDIPLLAGHFLMLLKKQGRTRVNEISPGAFSAMSDYKWPGNVRELRNCIDKAVLFAGIRRHERVEIQDLPSELSNSNLNSLSKDFLIKIPDEGIDLEMEKAKYEFSCIEAALQRSSGRKKEAWKLLGLNDRFALRRRVLTLAKRFPSLMEAYPLTRDSFFNKGSATPTYSRSD